MSPGGSIPVPDQFPTVGLIGIGRMGLALARNWLGDGYRVVGSSRGKTAEFIEAGGEVSADATPAAVAERSDVVFTCLPTETSFEEVISGADGIARASGTMPMVVADLSTISLPVLRSQAAELQRSGCPLLSCPISGTPKMIEAKRGMAFASGDPEAFAVVAEILRVAIPTAAFVGPLGAGASFKYVANLLVAVHAAVAAEAMALADRAGLDQELLVRLISASPGATSGQFDVRAPMMAADSFVTLGTVDLLRKDLEFIEELVDRTGAEAPLFTRAKRLYDEMSQRGQGDEDIAQMVRMLKEKAQSAETTEGAG